ncbi:MAG: helix-turn-helix domain-containing protein [archaeon]|jgi:sugar-specific transcriptional regulator TrmB
MRNRSENLETLFKTTAEIFDLNGTEAKIISFLIKSNTLTVGKLGALSDIPRNKIYESARGLQKKGLIEIVVSKPLTLHSLLTRDMVKNKIREKILEINEFEKELSAENNYSETCVLIKNYYANDQKLVSALSNAKKENFAKISMWIATPESCVNIQEAVKRNVNVEIIGPKPEKDDLLPIKRLKQAGAKIGFINDDPSIRFSIFDSSQMRLTLSTPSKTRFNHQHIELWITNSELIKIMKDYFEKLRKKSEKFF